MHRVTRGGVRGLKVEMRRSRQAIANAPKRHPRRGEAAQIDPVRWRTLLDHAIAVPRLPTAVHWRVSVCDMGACPAHDGVRPRRQM